MVPWANVSQAPNRRLNQFSRFSRAYEHWQIQGGSGGMPPRHVGKRQNALKVAIFRLKIENISGEMPPPQTPASFPLHKSQRSFQHACFVA